MNLITIQEAAIRYNKSQNTLTSTAAMHHAKHGRYPKWYQTIKGKQLTRINTDEYEKLGHLERKAWIFATDMLFWAFADLGINQRTLSSFIAKRSKRYNSAQSWNSFLQNNLFNIPPQIISEGEKSMRIEFVQHGTRIIYEMIKRGECEIHRQ